MQLTIELPADLAKQLEPQMDKLVEIIQRGLAATSSGGSLIEEIFEFLARRPTPEEIVAYHPSAQCSERLLELLEKNRNGLLSSAEEAELDTFESLNHFFALVKLQARQQLPTAA